MASGAFASAGLVRQGRGRILEIDTRKLLPVVIAHDDARFLFFGGARWREATGHY
jgi:hypothetical protein